MGAGALLDRSDPKLAMETLQHRLAAVWFADIVGFTRQAAKDEGRALHVVQAFQQAARDVARRYDGRIVKFIGDEAMAEFSSTESAVRAAIRLSQACVDHASRLGVECPTLRIAVHVGDVATTDDGDIYGDGVNVASRIVKEVAPGEVWVSEDVWRQLRQRPRFSFRELGTHELKGVEPVELYAVVGGQGEDEERRAAFAARGRKFLGELHRRHVYRVALFYAVAGWLVIQMVGVMSPALGFPSPLARAIMFLVLFGFPVALVLAWVYEITPQGIRRDEGARGATVSDGRGFVRQVAVATALAGAVVAWIAFGPEKPAQSAASGDASEAALEPSRIAVLYFDDHSQGRRLAHLADGLTEGLIHDLSQLDTLDVISRNGVKPYRESAVPLDSIARALKVGTIVEGSVDQSGDQLRVTVQLIDAREMTHLASWSHEEPLGELFALQDDIVGEISQELRQRLGVELRLRQRRARTTSLEAWELVQRAEALREQTRATSDQSVAQGLRHEADGLLARAERLDPHWIEPIVLRATLANDEQTTDSYVRAESLAGLALATDPRSSRALAARGVARYRLAGMISDSLRAARVLASAEADLRRAVVEEPSYARAWITLSDLLYNAKWDLASARKAAERAYEEDEFLLEEWHFIWLGEISLQLKDYEAALAWCEEGRRRFPESVGLLGVQLGILASPNGPQPDAAQSWRLVEQIGAVAPASQRELFVSAAQLQTAAVLARAGLRDSAQQVARRVRARPDIGEDPFLDYYEAHLRLLLGDRDKALDRLESFLTSAPSYRSIVARDHWFETLSGDPRFESIVDREHWPIFCATLCRGTAQETN